jgi:ABC-type multidrug transport system ATPase subunit
VARNPRPANTRPQEILAVKGLRRTFNEHVVLDNVSVSIRAGQICAVTGPNGAGKTTLLRCVSGTLAADAGTIMLLGKPVDESDPHTRAAVATVLDDVEFFPDLSVAEHLELMAYAHATDDPITVVDDLLEALSLDSARDQVPPTLSSGQRRRLALASCFVRPRRLLVLDEPEQRLDTRGREWLREQLLREKKNGSAVLMASHDTELVDAVADQRLPIGD